MTMERAGSNVKGLDVPGGIVVLFPPEMYILDLMAPEIFNENSQALAANAIGDDKNKKKKTVKFNQLTWRQNDNINIERLEFDPHRIRQ